MASKFNVGDRVVALKDNGYEVTNNGWTGVVTERSIENNWFCAQGEDGVVHFQLDDSKFELIANN